MGFLLVLPILICGFIYCRYNFYDKTLTSKYEGQTLYFHIALRGFLVTLPCLLFSFIIEYLTNGYFGLADLFVEQELTGAKERHIFSILIFCIFTAPFFTYYIAKARFKLIQFKYNLKNDYLTRFFILETMLPTSTNQALLLHSLSEKHLYMFSMEDRKVYIGCVQSIGSLQDHDSNVDEGFSIIPIYSGYRNKDTLTVELTTPYEKVYKEFKSIRSRTSAIANGSEDARIQNGDKADDIGSLFSVSLLQKNICSMTRFEHDVWHDFKKNEIKQVREERSEA
ncbi:hypothetical protein NYP20_09150 [Pseudomonas sp. N3-W]|jgi:hypothetical protein|uniref:Uncharacterized protein n=1 Tax=Pseudomonas fungipugnans TaxID=3024217 RepID=A0ABT6QV29_9PSED|nr:MULTISPECIES: hypothetical protein [unclassified Pseudomonas]MDI2594762.1 hypothetical protein [Pseudomonas sp. 681]UWF51109.1 hypothetical protein NYP20_09150 [Pseudomonas sp. N3-W]